MTALHCKYDTAVRSVRGHRRPYFVVPKIYYLSQPFHILPTSDKILFIYNTNSDEQWIFEESSTIQTLS